MSAEKKPEVPVGAAAESTPAAAPPKAEEEAPDPDEDDLDDLDGWSLCASTGLST